MILAFDPGKTTGWAALDEKVELTSGIRTGQIPAEMAWDMMHETMPRLIVCETFTHRMVGNVDYTPAEVIGVVKLYSRLELTPVLWQSPAQAKHFFTNDRLKERGFYVPAQPHGMDALRHLLYAIEFGEG